MAASDARHGIVASCGRALHLITHRAASTAKHKANSRAATAAAAAQTLSLALARLQVTSCVCVSALFLLQEFETSPKKPISYFISSQNSPVGNSRVASPPCFSHNASEHIHQRAVDVTIVIKSFQEIYKPCFCFCLLFFYLER